MTMIRLGTKDDEGKRDVINLTLSMTQRDFLRLNKAINLIRETNDGEDFVKLFLFDCLAKGFESMNYDVNAWIEEEKLGRFIGLDQVDSEPEILTDDLISTSDRQDNEKEDNLLNDDDSSSDHSDDDPLLNMI